MDKTYPKNIIPENTAERPFGRLNFIVMAASIVAIVLGFMLMAGGGSDDPNVYNPEIFSARRIVVGPLIAFLGFVGVAVGIILRPKKS